MSAPFGQLTRGATGYNRLRRSDRWLVHSPRVRATLLSATDPLVVDLGYGAFPVTTLELAARVRVVRNDIRVVGLEIDPERADHRRHLRRAGPTVLLATARRRRAGEPHVGLRSVRHRAPVRSG